MFILSYDCVVEWVSILYILERKVFVQLSNGPRT
jgi:hypothetical protein